MANLERRKNRWTNTPVPPLRRRGNREAEAQPDMARVKAKVRAVGIDGRKKARLASVVSFAKLAFATSADARTENNRLGLNRPLAQSVWVWGTEVRYRYRIAARAVAI